MAQYDPETLILLRTALDEAWALLPGHRKSDVEKSEMAQRILMQAADGVRDPVKLRAAALIGAVDGSSEQLDRKSHGSASQRKKTSGRS